ncbi:putative DNA binding domain-containing protein [Corynebacterium hindlerae]|uniref:Putative DNA binding domain-containing protein n=1 Tax=Corynebacterium hindlerae TaxID=699041 RepID=A0A7G5FHI9_9CORY|nr:RNA-binding domain-containing protein [Corynebacterium hindlerae]QMV86080.1 putative DNA binding domain-containing protein [Corynebacterium hindlerae]
MNSIDVAALVNALIESETDTWNIEAKAASKGLPGSIDETLSAFANMPEGGTIVLGVSEINGIVGVTGVSNPKELMAALATKARERIVPPVQLGAVETALVDGAHVVVCVVPPQPSDRRPFRVGAYGRAYTRSGDGDHQLDEQEELYLISQRSQPLDDRQPVEGADVDRDLIPDLLEQYLASQKSASTRLRQLNRDELLIRTNVVDHATGAPTVAAVYAMGIHPQQFLPHTSVKAHARPDSGGNPQTRLTDRAEFSGPVPDLLFSAMEWVSKHLMRGVTFDSFGHGHDASEIPPVAVREIIANALVHRDLSSASTGSYPMIVKLPTKLIVESPGGLWGLTERELGKTSPRARNPVLYRMCSAITSEDGKRVVEGHATGIPEVTRSLREAFLPAPYFKDEVIKFRAILSSSSMLSQDDLSWLATLPGGNGMSVAQRHALVAMKQGKTVSNADYRSRFPMDSVQARGELQELVRFGLATTTGSGRSTEYMLAPRTDDNAVKTSTRIEAKELSDDSETTRPKQLVIAALSRIGAPMRRNRVAKETGLKGNHAYRILKELIAEGVVGYDKDPDDKRAFRYFLKRPR